MAKKARIKEKENLIVEVEVAIEVAEVAIEATEVAEVAIEATEEVEEAASIEATEVATEATEEVEIEATEEVEEAAEVEVETIQVHLPATLPTRQSKEKPKIDNSEKQHFHTRVVQSEVTPLSSNAHTIHEQEYQLIIEKCSADIDRV